MRLRTPASCAVILLLAACAGGSPVSADLEQTAAPGGHVAFSQVGDTPGCRPDDKLLGRYLLSTGDGPFTWWTLTREGLVAAGIAAEDYPAVIGSWLGQDFHGDLAAAKAALIEAARVVDGNGNGYICPHRIRGTRPKIGDPNYANYLFRTYDDFRLK